MIKQICLFISKLTLLGYVIESCSAHKGVEVHLWVGKTHMNTLTRTTISPLHTPTTTVPLQGISQIMECRRKELGDGASPLRDAWGRNQRRGKVKITVTWGEASMRNGGLWWQEGQVTCEQAAAQYVCPATLCLSCQTADLLLQLFLGPLFGAHVPLQDMESGHRSQGLVGLWCQQSRVWASAGPGAVTRSTKRVSKPAEWPWTWDRTHWPSEAAEGAGCWRNKEGSKVRCWRICGVWDWQLSMCMCVRRNGA